MQAELLSQIKVLLVDDKQTTCELVEKTLLKHCNEIICTTNTHEAIEIFLEHGNFDIVITDIGMPQIDGIMLIKEIRKYYDTIPIIVTSTYPEIKQIHEIINLGISGYVYKPFEIDFLISTIEKAVKEKILRKELEKFNYDLISELKKRTYELNTILNTQENLIAVSNTNIIHTANSKFLHFFAMDKLDNSNNYLQALFESFIKDNDYFYFDTPHDIDACIKELQEHINDIYVKMKDSFNKTYSFKLQVTNYDYHGLHLVFSFTDITAIKNKSDTYRYKASHDALTSLYNRFYFHEVLTHEINRATRYNKIFILVMFDIDHFKTINDTYGHDIGDEVLIKLSVLVKKYLRKTDIIARWGGEEFMIFMPETNISNAINKIDMLRVQIEQTQLLQSLKKPVTVSFGVTEFLQGDTKNTLLKRVDVAMYNAKNNGRNKIESL
jgi:diguanylate cyclase (GGDEF)-like protein